MAGIDNYDDRIQRTDHDTLIRLETIVTGIARDVKELKEGTAQRLALLESRISDLEKTEEQFPAKTTAEKAIANAQWINDFNVRWKVVVGAASIISSSLTIAIVAIANYLQVFKK